MKLVDSEDEEVYALRCIILPYIDYTRSCSHSNDIIPHVGGGKDKLIHQRVERQPSPEQMDILTATGYSRLPFYTEARTERRYVFKFGGTVALMVRIRWGTLKMSPCSLFPGELTHNFRC